jgi:DNA-binding NarL/FixJ family response regulator
MSHIDIVIVDDQRLFASSLKIVLESLQEKQLSVIGIAHDGNECLAQLETTRPDIVLMDVRMPELDGVETTKIIHKKYPNIKIMMLSTFGDDMYVHHALLNGATGYILKNIEPEELITSIEAIFNGSMVVSSSVGYRVFSDESESEETAEGDIQQTKVNYLRSRFKQLTRREAEVLYLLLQGFDNRQISLKLCIAEQTVRNYASAIYSIIGVDGRLHALQLLGLNDQYFGTSQN